jgi:hypothetical protein
VACENGGGRARERWRYCTRMGCSYGAQRRRAGRAVTKGGKTEEQARAAESAAQRGFEEGV